MSALYKFTGPDGVTHDGFRWPLPTEDGPGEWADVHPRSRKALTVDDLCTSRVLHVTDAEHLLDWINAELYEVEVDETRGIVRGPDKAGVRRARLVRRVETWNDRTARIFAADCAEDVLHLIPDGVSRLTCEIAIYVARCFADGEASREELAAAGDAAGDAARAAAWDAARAAARVAAWAAARAAARDAAWAKYRANLVALLGLVA